MGESSVGYSIEFFGYHSKQHKTNGCTVLFTKYQSTKACQATKAEAAKNKRDVLHTVAESRL